MSNPLHPMDPAMDRATAKLKRQQQRIIDNEAALAAATRSRRRRKPKTDWKPFSLANSSEENFSMSDSAESRIPTPFDVHAKVFKPNAVTSRDSSPAPALNTSQATSSMPHPSLNRAEEDDEDGGFQLVTGRKTKSLPRPAHAPPALNAYESRSPDPAQSVAASFNKKEINEVFGNDLPPPEFVESIPGLKNGQVQFVIHPNGDVAAQQWSGENFHWINIGQFSNRRQRREGMIASQRLKGETEQQSLMQNSLAYFHAAVKQCEADVLGLPWGHKEISAYLPPAPPISTSKARAKPDEVAKEELKEPARDLISRLAEHAPATPVNIPSKMPLRPRRRAVATGTPVMPMLPHADTNSSLENMSFGGFPAASVQGVDPLWFPFGLTPPSFTMQQHLSPDALRAVPSYVDNQSWVDGMQGLSEFGRSPPVPSVYGGPPGLGFDTPLDATSPSFVSNRSRAVASPQVAVPVLNNSWLKSKRSSMRESLTKIGITATARAAESASASRTVLHDPLRDDVMTTQQVSPLKAPSFYEGESSSGGVSLAGINAFNTSILPAVDNAAVDSEDARRELFFVSEPDLDPCPWNTPRAVDLGPADQTRSLSNEQLAIFSAPTPQNWKGPFFQSSADQSVPKKSYDEELKDWFTGGNTRARHDMMYERIKAAHAAAPKHPGPIKPPSATSTSAQSTPRDSVDLDQDMTRLLIPVLGNLASYVQGPMEKRRGPFARYAPPPEWCIDRGPNGNKSFFEDDWGQPPERIGRDSRYRPLTYEGRYASFETPAPAIGTLTSLGRSVQPLEGRYKFGGARKW